MLVCLCLVHANITHVHAVLKSRVFCVWIRLFTRVVNAHYGVLILCWCCVHVLIIDISTSPHVLIRYSTKYMPLYADERLIEERRQNALVWCPFETWATNLCRASGCQWWYGGAGRGEAGWQGGWRRGTTASAKDAPEIHSLPVTIREFRGHLISFTLVHQTMLREFVVNDRLKTELSAGLPYTNIVNKLT